jgi:hypothetical protein
LARRKTRVTKEEIKALREQKKNYNSQKAKKTIKPGPWTDKSSTFTLETTLRKNKSIIPTIPDYLGAYQESLDWTEKGWYPIIVNVQIPTLQIYLNKYGTDSLIVALEKSLNRRKQQLGDVIILKVLNFNLTQEFVGVEAKTNKKHIQGFTAIRGGRYLYLE